MEKRKITTLSLTWPIFVETLLRTTLMSVDTFMLSRYADEAAAAVGMLQQITFFMLIIYLMGSTGASILISQNLGAKKPDTATEVGRAALMFNLFLGLGLSLLVRLMARAFLGTLNLEGQVEEYAAQYLLIYVSFSFFQALSLVMAQIMRSYGYSKTPMMVNMGANILNAIGNYLFIFGPFGIPVLGVTGVAISTVTSQALGMAVLLIIISRKKDINLFGGRLFPIAREHIRNIFKIGIPSAGEFLSYNLSQIAIIYAVTSLGTAALASYSYVINITRFSFVIAMSLGQSTQILVGHRIGAGKQDEAFRSCLKNLGWGAGFSLFLMGLMAIFRFPLIGLLTQDPDITAIAGVLMVIAVIHETARPMNLIVIAGLRGAGDVRFPVVIGMIIMWGVGVAMAYTLGIGLGWGMVGIWIARVMDEWIRGLIMVKRWVSRKWENRSFVSSKEAD